MFGIFGKKNSNSSTPNTTATANTSTVSNSSPTKVSLKKAEESLERSFVRLEKSTGVNLKKHKARVFVQMDKSGSMSSQFRNGSVQAILTRLLPLALRFDDNGELEVYLFDVNCEKVQSMTLQNYENYVKDMILNKGKGPCGRGTNYAPAINQAVNDYNDGSPLPAFGIFITDGKPDDKTATNRAIRDSSKYKIFFKFVGTGNIDEFEYLEKLDNLDGRPVDNTAFIRVKDFAKLTDDELYDLLLDQYTDWLKAMHIY